MTEGNAQEDLTLEPRNSPRRDRLGRIGFGLSLVPLAAVALLLVLQPG